QSRVPEECCLVSKWPRFHHRTECASPRRSQPIPPKHHMSDIALYLSSLDKSARQASITPNHQTVIFSKFSPATRRYSHVFIHGSLRGISARTRKGFSHLMPIAPGNVPT